MEREIEKVTLMRLTEDGNSTTEDDIVVREFPLTILLNNQELVTLLCSPRDLKYLAVGYLASEGLLSRKDDIKKVMVDEQRGIVRVQTTGETVPVEESAFKRLITSGCGRGASFYRAVDLQSQIKIESSISVKAEEVLSLVRDFQHRSEVFQSTGGVHSAALCDSKSILIFSEDIGRHNAIDKIFGQCLLEDIPTSERMVVTSGRVSSEIMLKVAKRNIPILISKSAPTDLGIKLADDLGITLVGFVRGKRMNVYANDWRITRTGD